MSDKATQKKEYILEKARTIFATKGYKDVTMKDIVDACEISRGGLYLYFTDTKQIFLEVLKSEKSEEESLDAMQELSASELLMIFIKEQKKEILKKTDNLTVALYEYYFSEDIPKKENDIKKKFDMSVKVISKLIEYGVETGEFYCEDPAGCARNLMYVLEGLRIMSCTVGIKADTIDKEVLYILQNLLIEETED